ncbi:MAG: S8 family serine peptidase [Hyphomicrobiales bacterium]
MHSQPRWLVPSFVSLLLVFLLLGPPVARAAAPDARTIPGEVIIKFRPGAAASSRGQIQRDLHAAVAHRFDFIGAEHWKLSGVSVEAAIARYAHNPNVVYIEPNYVLTADVAPNDPRYPEMYGLHNTGQTGGTPGADISAQLAWDQFTGDPNLKVGVIDTGVDYNHPDLSANIWTNPGEIPGNGIDDDGNGYVDDVHGYDFVNHDGDPFDDNGHGTHTSGTIAAAGNNNTGVVGVNWQAKIVAIKFLSAGGSGSTSDAILGIQYAITVGVRLTSNSWGGGGFSQALLDAINAAGAAGQLFVAAAGNSGQNSDITPQYPAAYDTPYIISVAATDNNDNLASFSNYGATTVDIAAPGVSILSTLPGNSYGLLSGTSMATPHVAGVVALAMGRYPNVPNLQIKNLVLNAADVKPSLQGKCVTNGRLNAFMTIAEPDDTPPGTIADLMTSDPGSNTMRLTWTATGDDGNTGRATRYEIRYSTAPITDATFPSATLAAGPDPQSAGAAESFEVGGLAFSTPYYFAIKAFDEFNNAGGLSNVATGTTLGAPMIAASPPSFSADLLTGATATQTLTIQNVAQGTLDYQIPTPELAFSQPVVYDYQPFAKGETDPRVGPVAESKGGPDGYGYRWLDSDEPGGPAFDWVDLTAVGDLQPLSGDDATSPAIPIGFDFPFYGATFTDVRVCTNGWLSFSDGATSYDNQPLPNSGAPANLVAPMWDDLDFAATGHVYTYNDGARFIVAWVDVNHYQTGGPYTFEAILYPNGEIRYQYLSLGSPTNSATAGIQNASKSVGLTVAFNTTYLRDGLAVRIAPLRQWLSVTPTSGRVLAGQSATVQVRFDAAGLNGGTFQGTIPIQSNDPAQPNVSLPASLHVIGAPDIAVNPTSLDYGTIFVGATPEKTLLVTNPGTDDLVVTGIQSSDGTLTASPTSFTLHPLSGQAVTVTYAPTAPAALAATLTIESNDPDAPSLAVAVTGAAVPAPSFSVSPTAFDVALLTNTATSRPLRVSNSGGSDFTFTAETVTNAPSGSVTVGTDADNVPVGKGEADVQSGPAPLKSGGPDVFGYTYKDSDEPDGPAFSWVDVRTVGTQIPMTGDDQNTGPYPIGFSFPFYGNSFDSFRICTNGFVSFTSTKTTYTNTTIPNTGSTVPENLLAVYWDDFNFSTVQHAYYYNDGTKLVIQYQDVTRLSDTGTNTFEIVLYPNGTILYQYLTMNMALKTSGTIGIQNQDRNDGLQVVFNATYIKNSLAVRFRPPARFLTVSPASGTVPPGGFVDLNVGFNAADLFGGVYEGAVRIQGNDPVLPELEVPARLTVTGVPDIAATPDPVEFGNVFIGFPGIRELTIQNRGTDALVVSDITMSDPAYGVDNRSFTVPPLANAVVFVSFGPPTAGPRPATLTIHSNDPDTPAYPVALSGAGLVAPDIAVSPASLSATLPIPASSMQTVSVENQGGSDLTFVVGTTLTATSVPTYDELVLGKEAVDPRQGIRGTGGPDMFGYTWRDSDDPNGPAFDWVDLTAIGTPLTLTGDDANLQGVPIGFDFPFYGNAFNTINVCTNGWLSFTSTLTALTNQPLPNSGSGVPENLLAPFWDDLNPGSVQRLYTYRDGTRFILSFVAVPRYSSGGPYTFEVILYPSGRIMFQYLSMQGTRLNEATIGIQNATKDDGLTVVYNDAYVHDNLAIEFRTTPDWLVASPSSGTIPPGGSLPIQVTFNSADLFGGTYAGTLRLASNDPDEGVTNLPATLVAVGTPHVAATPAALDFGWLYIGQERELTVDIQNSGSDVVEIRSLSIVDPSWQLVDPPAVPFTLGNRAGRALTVRFRPPNPCVPPNPCLGQLLVESNDPNGALSVGLTGVAYIPPEASMGANSVRAALATTLGPTAETKTKILRMDNTGGSDLTWSAEGLVMLPAAVQAHPSAETGKDQPGEPGGPAALASGGPDAYGYRYADSDDPVQGTPFDWVDITSTGTHLPVNGDDQNVGPFPLPFPFPFYGNTFTEYRVCSNGWLSFTSSATSLSNTTLPNTSTSTPENLLAPFWDDLDLRSAGAVYAQYDGTRFIVEYAGVPRYSSGGPYTFEVILYPSGTIDFQYLQMDGTRLNEATIGIQNATKDIGLQVAYNQAYVKNNLRLRFSRLPGWLTVSPNSGVVPAGGHVDMNVTFTATGLADGDYSGALRIQCNDLTDPLIDVEANLHVGVVGAMVDLDPNTLNRASNGNWVSGLAEPIAGYEAREIDPSTVLLNRTIGVVPDAPIGYDDKDGNGLEEAAFKFPRIQLVGILPTGDNVAVEMIGEVKDASWFQGTDYVRVLKPKMVSSSGLDENKGEARQPKSYPAGAHINLAWDDPNGHAALYYELWYSFDGGESWRMVAPEIQGHNYSFLVIGPETTNGILELVAVDGLGAMGSWISEPFTVLESTPTAVEDGETALPKEFAFRIIGSNPMSQSDVRMMLAIPRDAPVDLKVYDVRGALVRNVATHPFTPGYHSITWDGRTSAGTAVASGVYFIRMSAAGKTFTGRVAIIR